MDTNGPTSDDVAGAAPAENRLFDLGEPLPPPPPVGRGTPRLRYAQRDQAEMRFCSLDELIPADHEVRQVWDDVVGLDLAPLLAQIKAVQGKAGAAATDPRILFALWLYATLRQLGSARELDRRCREDLAFRWLCGGVTLNYHTLADVRIGHGAALDQLLTSSVAVLLDQELVTLERVAEDGMRVRASAGASSFRRGPRWQQFLAEAEQQVAALQQELTADAAASTRRQRAARHRAAAERHQRVRQALAALPAVAAAKPAKEQDQARVSTTDAEARVRKMGDGGFRPACNVLLATATATPVIGGVTVSSAGNDQGQLAPMVAQLAERYQEKPQAMLGDGGFTKRADLARARRRRGARPASVPAASASRPAARA
ncbi:MAG: transposase [Planctomycetia bacterium]|nr:transposase [Planctomycetia bacterium]